MKKLQIMFFFIALSAVLFSCQNDESIEHNHSEQKISIQRKTFDKFEKLSALTEKLMTNTDLNRSGADSLYDFVIDSSMVTQAIAGQKTTYTMAIKRPISIEGTFENLIITDSVNINRAYIIKYTPSELYYARLQTNVHAPYIGNIKVQELNYDQLQQKGMSCTTLQFTMCDVEGTHRAGKLCKNTYTMDVTFCFNDVSMAEASYVDLNGVVHGGGAPAGGSGGSGGDGGNSDDPNLWDIDPENGEDTSPTITEPVIFDAAITNFKQGLNAAQLSWWNNVANNSKMQMLKTHLETNSFSDESENFTRWAIEYLRTHTNTTIAQFKNWFLTPREGNDGDYDAAFWENPNLHFPQQNLPTMENFLFSFPKIQNGNVLTNMSSSQVYQLVGGSIYSNHQSTNPIIRANYQNACSIRGSRALNYSGATIPVVRDNGVQKTEKGGDNENYILSAKAFNKYMNKTFGPPTFRLSFEDIGNDPLSVINFLNGKNGIYSIINKSPGQAGYSGHIDIIINGECLGGANANPNGGIDYIEIWELN